MPRVPHEVLLLLIWDSPFPSFNPLLQGGNVSHGCSRYWYIIICSFQFSRLVVSDSLWPHESQNARPPCPSQTPGIHRDSSPSSQWCHPDISSSVVSFSSCPQSVPASASFPMSQLFTWAGVSALVCFSKCSCLFSIYSADFLLYIWIIWLLFWVENI